LDYGTQSASELFASCAAGSAEAWDEFHRRYHKHIAGVVIRVLRNYSVAVHDTEDVIQEVYRKLWADDRRRLGIFRDQGPGSDFGYLKLLAERTALDWRRRTRTQSRNVGANVSWSDAKGAEPAAGDPLERAILIDQVHSAIADVADVRDRLIFWLHHRAGMTSAAIAARKSIGLTDKGVQSVLKRLKSVAQERLTPRQVSTKKAEDAAQRRYLGEGHES